MRHSRKSTFPLVAACAIAGFPPSPAQGAPPISPDPVAAAALTCPQRPPVRLQAGEFADAPPGYDTLALYDPTDHAELKQVALRNKRWTVVDDDYVFEKPVSREAIKRVQLAWTAKAAPNAEPCL